MHKWRGLIEQIPSKVSPRPWKVRCDYETDNLYLADKDLNVIIEDYSGKDISDYDIDHIVERVNSYEPAIREIERLQDVITKLMVNRDFKDFDKEVTKCQNAD